MGEKTALITGVSGQDGSYLAELLLDKGYSVVGTSRGNGGRNVAHLVERLRLVPHADTIGGLIELIETVRPTEIFNCAGQTHVSRSWDMPEETIAASAALPASILEAIVRTDRGIRFFQASSSEIFSLNDRDIFDESTPIIPCNPYGCAKAYAHLLVGSYRQNYGLYAVNGILFNHESPRRAEAFASRKIVKGAVAIKLGRQEELVMGNVAVSRDWSYAPDMVEAMTRMMHMAEPADLVLSSGVSRPLSDMVEMAFALLGLDHRNHLRFDPALHRVSELPVVRSSNARARKALGWEPRHAFRTMVQRMVDYELQLQTGQVADFAREKPFA